MADLEASQLASLDALLGALDLVAERAVALEPWVLTFKRDIACASEPRVAALVTELEGRRLKLCERLNALDDLEEALDQLRKFHESHTVPPSVLVEDSPSPRRSPVRPQLHASPLRLSSDYDGTQEL